MDQWRDKEATRGAVHVTIRDFLWSDETGLPAGGYSDEEVEARSDDVFRHVFRAYPTVPSAVLRNRGGGLKTPETGEPARSATRGGA